MFEWNENTHTHTHTLIVQVLSNLPFPVSPPSPYWLHVSIFHFLLSKVISVQPTAILHNYIIYTLLLWSLFWSVNLYHNHELVNSGCIRRQALVCLCVIKLSVKFAWMFWSCMPLKFQELDFLPSVLRFHLPADCLHSMNYTHSEFFSTKTENQFFICQCSQKRAHVEEFNCKYSPLWIYCTLRWMSLNKSLLLVSFVLYK